MDAPEPVERPPNPSAPTIDYLSIPIMTADGHAVPLHVPLDSFWLAFRAAAKLELDETLDLITFAWKLMRDFLQQGIATPERALADIAPLLADPLILTRPPDPVDRQSRDEALLRLGYKLLREQLWNSEQAAQFAAQHLEQPVTSELWEQRIAAWAAQHGLPPVTQGREHTTRTVGRSQDERVSGPEPEVEL
jgi:hypothetical protein